MQQPPKIPQGQLPRLKCARGATGSAGQAASAGSGFSLVEVLVAIVILGVAVVGLTQGITLAASSSKESELQTTAALFAAGIIENLRADEYWTDGETQGDCGEGLALYQWQETITSTSIPGLHEVEVVVQNSHTGQAIYELRTMLFQAPEDYTPTSQATTRKRGGR